MRIFTLWLRHTNDLCCSTCACQKLDVKFSSPPGIAGYSHLLVMQFSCVSGCHLVGLFSGEICCAPLQTSFEPPEPGSCHLELQADITDSYRPPRQGSKRCRTSERETRAMPSIGTRCPSWSRRCAAGPTLSPHAASECRPRLHPVLACASLGHCAVWGGLPASILRQSLI